MIRPRACIAALALFFIHFAGTSGWGYVQAVSPLRYVASLGALQNFASFMIASAAPVVTGWLLDRTHSFTIALGLCSAVTLLGALSYATLERVGNLSSAAVLHVLASGFDQPPGTTGLLFAVGPGVSAEFVLLDWAA